MDGERRLRRAETPVRASRVRLCEAGRASGSPGPSRQYDRERRDRKDVDARREHGAHALSLTVLAAARPGSTTGGETIAGQADG